MHLFHKSSYIYWHKSVKMGSRIDFRTAHVVPAPVGYARKTPNKKVKTLKGTPACKLNKRASVARRTGAHGYVIILRGERRK